MDVKEVQIDGRVYNRKNIPIEQFRIKLDIIHGEVVKIYSDIYAFVCSRCDEEKSRAYRNSFEALFYAQHIGSEMLPQLLEHRDKLLNELNQEKRRDQEILFQKVCLETLEQDSSICWLNNERYDQSKVWIPQSVIATYRPWTTLCKKRSIH